MVFRMPNSVRSPPSPSMLRCMCAKSDWQSEIGWKHSEVERSLVFRRVHYPQAQEVLRGYRLADHSGAVKHPDVAIRRLSLVCQVLAVRRGQGLTIHWLWPLRSNGFALPPPHPFRLTSRSCYVNLIRSKDPSAVTSHQCRHRRSPGPTLTSGSDWRQT